MGSDLRRDRLHGRVALVTGAGSGIGAATAARLADEGAYVVLTGRRTDPLREAAAPLGDRALVVPGDAADPAHARRVVDAAVAHFGGLDILVAGAGAHKPGAALDTDDAAWAYALRANLTSAFVTARACLPALVRARGAIVMVASIAGCFAGPGVAGYVTTKHAMIGLTRSLARDYGPSGVRVNAVCPGWVRTPMADEQMDDLAARTGTTREDAYAEVSRDTPLRRPGEPAEIAAVIAFLASDDASVMTGSVVVADAGAGCVDLPTIAFDPDRAPRPATHRGRAPHGER
jgi:NAD(P)-dependent dehydrogenase (short-subunit alcohol dehydrogenase family)